MYCCVFPLQDPAGIFELIEVVGNGTYGQVHKVLTRLLAWGRGLISSQECRVHL